MIEKAFVTAGRAVFTVEPSDTFRTQFPAAKPHYTYRVKFAKGKPKAHRPEEKWPDSYWVTILTGPDNTADYSPLGKLNVETGEISLTSNSKFAGADWSVQIIRRVIARIWKGEQHEIAANGWKVHHEGKCGRCARALTVPESIQNGIGPECMKKVFGESHHQPL